jgi:hypothetical protein
MSVKKEHSELLKLLDQRHKELGLGDGKPFRTPTLDRNAVERAADLHAEANKSDPFARGRMLLHLHRGIDSVGDVEKAARSILAARHRGTVL